MHLLARVTSRSQPGFRFDALHLPQFCCIKLPACGLCGSSWHIALVSWDKEQSTAAKHMTKIRPGKKTSKNSTLHTKSNSEEIGSHKMGIQGPQNDKAKSKAARARTSENNEHRPRTQAWQISEKNSFSHMLGDCGVYFSVVLAESDV